VLAIRGLSKRFGERTLLKAFDLSVAPGEMVAVIGESGAGKSTLLNIVAGLEDFDRGTVEVDGRDIGTLDDDGRTLLRRRAVGFVFQAFHILPYLSVAENVAVPLRLLEWRSAARAARVGEMLADVGLAERAGARPRELSGGELQRVAIARALVHRPKLLLADEPTGNLDPATAGEVLGALVREVRRNAAAGLLVTHSAQAASLCDRVVRIQGGAAVEQRR
jgi:putative ABC transport system ATP-binding protein